MTIMELGAIGEFLGSVVVIVSVIYLAAQVRQNTAQQKREETISIHRGQNEVVAQMMDPAVIRAFALVADGDAPASIEDRARTIMWVILYLNHFQIVYDLHHQGTLDGERYAVWELYAVAIVACKGIRAWWDGESGKLAFTPNMRALIDRRLDDPKIASTPLNEMWSIFGAEAWRSRQPVPEA